LLWNKISGFCIANFDVLDIGSTIEGYPKLEVMEHTIQSDLP
jgi:hypothetical protein